MATNTVRLERKPVRPWRWVLGIVGGIVLITMAFFGYSIWRMNNVPANLDLSTTRLTANKLYRVSYSSAINPIPINRLHAWTLRVTAPDGTPLEHARIGVDGDMPQHGHGLPTRPQVTAYQGDGTYLVEGVKFQMGGWWVMDFTVTHDGKTDAVRFNLLLK